MDDDGLRRFANRGSPSAARRRRALVRGNKFSPKIEGLQAEASPGAPARRLQALGIFGP
jgi:hypothetical protein